MRAWLIIFVVHLEVTTSFDFINATTKLCYSKHVLRQYYGMAFDAYGTLLDVSTVPTKRATDLNLPREFSQLWREKQLSYTWLRATMGRYVDFWEVTKNAMDYALNYYNRTLTSDDRKYLLGAWYHLEPFPDVIRGLERLKSSGYLLYILSNGTPRMLARVLKNSGLRSYFKEVVSVDAVKTYKPSPRVYAWLEQSSCIPKSKLLFVSSNSWDGAGAKSYSYNTAWLNRSRGPRDVLGFPPNYYFFELNELSLAFS